MEELSRRLYRQLECTGYNLKMMAARGKVYRNIASHLSLMHKIKCVISGSRGEGEAKIYESDRDTLLFLKNIVCIDSPELVNLVPEDVTVFNILHTQPGYCLVELVREGSNVHSILENSLVPYNETVLLSSQAFRIILEEHEETEAASKTVTGPALSTIHIDGSMYDHVLTISCPCKAILEKWFNRPRTNDWPPLHVRQTVLQMTGNLVATGMNGSETEHLEWRYCFNEIEMLIMGSLNDTQLKLYKLLKIINNDILKKQDHTIPSFMLKNIILWLAETHPQSQFLPETLYHWVCEALLQLKRYIEANIVPYYMIPGRNLLKEKVKESDRPKLIQLITDVIESGPIMPWECETIKKYSALTPHDLHTLKEKLETLELCELYICDRFSLLRCQKQDPDNDPLLRCLVDRREQILTSGWPLQLQQECIGADTNTIVLNILSR